MKNQKKIFSFVFACSCGCGQFSEPLGKDYIRLQSNEKWYVSGCQPTEGRQFKNGFIVKQSDF